MVFASLKFVDSEWGIVGVSKGINRPHQTSPMACLSIWWDRCFNINTKTS